MNITKLLPVIGLAAGLLATASALAGGPFRSGPILSHNWTVGMNSRGSAAIVARTWGDFYDKIVAGHPYSPAGGYGYPQHFCMVEVQPNNGALLVRMPDGKTSAALNDGDFAPDASRGNCDTVAVAVPPGLAGSAAAPPPGNEAATDGAPHWLVVALGMVMAALLSLAEYRYISKSLSPEGRAALFARKQNEYSFNKITGEWQKITSRGLGGSTLVSTEARNKRLVKEHTAILEICGLTLAVNLGLVALIADPNPPVDVSAPVGLVGLVVWTFGALCWLHKVLVIDPLPVKPDEKPFGESSPFRAPPVNGSDGMDYEMPV